MIDELAEFYVHETQYAAFQGSGSTKDVFADAVPLLGLVEDENKLIRAASGEQVVSSARVFYPAGTVIVLRSRVTLPAPFLGRSSTVIAVSRFDSGGLALPDHVVAALL